MRAFAHNADGALNGELSTFGRASAVRCGAKVCAALEKYHVASARRLLGSGACVGAATSLFVVYFRVQCAIDPHTISYTTALSRASSVSRCRRRIVNVV